MTEIQPSIITLCDSSAEPLGCAGLTYRWNGYTDNKNAYSLLSYVDINGERLRNKYLAWIHDLGEARIGGIRMQEYLALDGELSYWWMTLLVEKGHLKSPIITDAIRLLALEEIIVQHCPVKFRLVSANRKLHEAISDLCRNLGIAYEWERLSGRTFSQLNFRGIFHALPEPSKALFGLARYLYIRWPRKQEKRPVWAGGTNSLFFCDFFENIDPKDAEQGYFHSHFWGGLPALAHRTGWHTNWMHLFVPSAMATTPREAVCWAHRFNQNRREQGTHAILDAYLTLPVVARVIWRWCRLVLVSWKLGSIKAAFRPQNSRLNLWPLMRGEWFASMRGSAAINNLLWFELLDIALREIPRQAKGLYLCENQAWERALIHLWRKHGHGQLIAVAHSTVRFWDMRYFADLRTVLPVSNTYKMPRADIVALNGRTAVDAYIKAGYPKGDVAECEALRYGYLTNLRRKRDSGAEKREGSKVLILGDYLPSSMIKMLQLLKAAVPHITSQATYSVKPHPNLLNMPEGFSTLDIKVVAGTMESLLHEYDIAYSSNLTSAAIDAYLFGLPVVVMLDDMELNFSPLRNQPGVRFVNTPEELADALQTAAQDTVSRPDSNDFFFLDTDLPRWSHLLAS